MGAHIRLSRKATFKRGLTMSTIISDEDEQKVAGMITRWNRLWNEDLAIGRVVDARRRDGWLFGAEMVLRQAGLHSLADLAASMQMTDIQLDETEG